MRALDVVEVSAAGVFAENVGRNNRRALRQHVKPQLQRTRNVCGNANAAQCCCALRPFQDLMAAKPVGLGEESMDELLGNV